MPSSDNPAKTSRRTIVIAWGSWALSPILLATAMFVDQKVGPDREGWQVIALAFIALSTVGAIIVVRRSSNPIGWIFLLAPVVANIGNFASSYANVALVAAPGTLPGGYLAAWVASWVWYVAMMSIALIPLLFPEGVPSPRWRPFLWLGVGGMVLLGLSFGLAPGRMDWSPQGTAFSNPIGVEALRPWVATLQGIAGVAWMTCFGVGVVRSESRCVGRGVSNVSRSRCSPSEA